VGEEPTGSITSYFLGSEPSKWRTGLADCSALRYRNIHPGIDLVYRIQGDHIKYESVVAPNADPRVIALRNVDADTIEVRDNRLSVLKEGREMEDGGLRTFQSGRNLDDVVCGFRSHGGRVVDFSVECYDTSRELVMDPAISLAFSTFLGEGSPDRRYGIAVEIGCAYVTGDTLSSDFPTVGAYDSPFNGGYDCFVSVLSFDSDMDGLLDWNEARYGTDRLCIDSDNDNFLDGYEVAYGSDATDPMSYPAMPQAWYEAICEDLDGNATLIRSFISRSNGNATLLQTVMQQLGDNATLVQKVVTWLDGNHTASETLFTWLDGNATLLYQMVIALNTNATLVQNLLS
jgi:hypothetical protein